MMVQAGVEVHPALEQYIGRGSLGARGVHGPTPLPAEHSGALGMDPPGSGTGAEVEEGLGCVAQLPDQISARRPEVPSDGSVGHAGGPANRRSGKMPQPTNERIEAYFDKHARGYDREMGF